METSPPPAKAVERIKRAKGIVVALVLVASAAVIGAASASTCSREVVSGNLDGSTPFFARDVIVYANGMFPGNPVVVRLEGHVEQSGWVSVRLPGVQAIDQLRVVGNGPRVTGYFLEEGALHFSVEVGDGATPGPVEIFYVAGSAYWSHHYELDFARLELALIGRVQWQSNAMFREVDMLFVSGKVHSVPAGAYGNNERPPAAAGGGSDWFGLSGRVASAETGGLAAFSVPSSSDEGIYVVHRAANIDMPGSNGHGLRSCKPTAFYLRIHTSPVEATELVVVTDAQISASFQHEAGTVGPALELEVRNRGTLPWMPGRADIYRTGILAGADEIAYTPRNGTLRIEMGTALDIQAAKTVETQDNRTYHNYTVKNVDVSDYTVEVVSNAPGQVGGHGAFVRDGGVLKARLVVGAGDEVKLGWWGPA
jgi:hypothetical protein